MIIILLAWRISLISTIKEKMGYSPGNVKMLTQFSNASINRKIFLMF